MAGSLKHEVLGVELGFLEKTEKWCLQSRYFPSKVGGKPAWLDLKNLPPSDQLLCKLCQKPFTFLAQIYAPDDDDEDGKRHIKETCYHRTFFVFFCSHPPCNKKNSNESFIVFRCQLPKMNEFYPPVDPPNNPHWKEDIVVEKFSHTCIVCGCSGKNRCGRCKKVNYCSRDHQIVHWTFGHKKECGEGAEIKELISMYLMPEFEIVIDDEKHATKETDEETELKEFEKIVKSQNPTFQDNLALDTSLSKMAVTESDKTFAKFRETISSYPDQVLRYDKGNTPLWVSDSNIPDTIPNCELCGSKRRFEFQIMPQLLNYLNLDTAADEGVDWGTLAIYSCESNCDEGPAYKTEYLWKQDFSSETIA